MNAQIAALHALHMHDRRMVALETRLQSIPKRLEAMSEDLARLQTMLDTERTKLEATVSFRREQETQLADEEEHIRNSKARLGSVKTSRELSAAQREIESTRRMTGARADEIDKLTDAIESAETRIGGMQESLDNLEQQIHKERDKLAEEQERLEAIIARDAGARAQLSEAVDLKIRRGFERIRRKAGGVAFVPVRERRCGGCRMQVPHRIYVGLRKGTDIPGCESCGRLLYWAGHFPEEAQSTAPAPTEAST